MYDRMPRLLHLPPFQIDLLFELHPAQPSSEKLARAADGNRHRDPQLGSVQRVRDWDVLVQSLLSWLREQSRIGAERRDGGHQGNMVLSAQQDQCTYTLTKTVEAGTGPTWVYASRGSSSKRSRHMPST